MHNFILKSIYLIILTLFVIGFILNDSNTNKEEKDSYKNNYILKIQKPDFTSIQDINKKKEVFFSYFYKISIIENNKIKKIRSNLIKAKIQNNQDYIKKIAQKYKQNYNGSDKDYEELLKKVDIIPPSLILAQAANESAWGKSRFAIEGNNYFGEWCFKKNCGIIPKMRDSGQFHEVKKFDSPIESVASYIHNLNSNNAYSKLRNIRYEERKNFKNPLNGIKLAKGLENYSSRKQEYINEIISIIEYNKLENYDKKNSI